jgi:hypothetical protein
LGYVVAYRIQTMEIDETELEQVKADVYETWAVINRAFEHIITALNKLEKTGVLKWDYVHNHSVITNDLWAKINSQIMADVGRREADDRNHYGKMRATIERRIRGRQ